MYWNHAAYNQRSFNIALDAVRARRPAMVIWAQSPPQWISADEFRRILERGYRPVGEIGGIGLFERR
jgi:hypothetical protein